MRGLDPRICGIICDANALDRIDASRSSAVDCLLQLVQDKRIRLVVPRTVRSEILNPHTPEEVQDALLPQFFTLGVGYNQHESSVLQKVRQILQGNARRGKHEADANHLAEAAQKAGGGYFITHDSRILKLRDKLHKELPVHFRIVTLEEFLSIYEYFVRRRPDLQR